MEYRARSKGTGGQSIEGVRAGFLREFVVGPRYVEAEPEEGLREAMSQGILTNKEEKVGRGDARTQRSKFQPSDYGPLPFHLLFYSSQSHASSFTNLRQVIKKQNVRNSCRVGRDLFQHRNTSRVPTVMRAHMLCHRVHDSTWVPAMFSFVLFLSQWG